MDSIYYRSHTTFDREYKRCNDTFSKQNSDATFDEFSQACLRCHNHFRAQHGSPPLQLSIEVSKFSQQWANQIAKEDHLHHSHHPMYGENLFVTYLSGNSLPMTAGDQVVESWYSEHKLYPTHGCVTRETVLKAGHFTQVVWSNSRELGIGKAVSRTHRVYVVANYYPAGNILNKFSMNVSERVFSSCGRPQYAKRMSSRILDCFHHGFCARSWTGH